MGAGELSPVCGSFQSYPLGHSINGSPHSVCVSLPTMADVIGYEEKDPRVLETFMAAYPRFFRNPLVGRLAGALAGEGGMQPGDPLLPDRSSAEDLCAFLGMKPDIARPAGKAWTVPLPESPELRKRAGAFLQHTGGSLSSREAEALLAARGLLDPFLEERAPGSAESHRETIRQHLHDAFGTVSVHDIHLFRSGMNAFYAGFRALQSVQLARGRDLWIQLGWLYVDTTRVLECFAPEGSPPLTVIPVLDLAELKEVLTDNRHRVAGIVTEVPTNPLLQTPDLEQLRSLADRCQAGLILDPTLASPHNIEILEYADLVVNSLTKYAAIEGDVMMGALILNARSRFHADLVPLVTAWGSSPGPGDLARLAAEIGDCGASMAVLNRNAAAVAAFLEGDPRVRQVYWAESAESRYHYNWLKHRLAGPGGILSFVPERPLAAFYDASRLVKSPSFGTRFSMMCPFLYLAHYDLAGHEAGRARLRASGLEPDLVRLSVGLEPAEAILAELDRTL